jgi:hypothetical protein
MTVATATAAASLNHCCAALCLARTLFVSAACQSEGSRRPGVSGERHHRSGQGMATASADSAAQTTQLSQRCR